MNLVELKVFFVKVWFRKVAGVFPRRDVGELFVVALGFTVVVLMLDAEVTAAAFLTIPRIQAEQLGELEEVGYAARFLKLLVECLT